MEAEVKPVEVEVLLVEEDLDLVEQEKQTKWLAEMMVNNLPGQFSRVLSMHLLGIGTISTRLLRDWTRDVSPRRQVT